MEFTFENFVINTYDDIKPYLDDLLSRELTHKEDTLQWLKDMDNLTIHIQEDASWRSIRHSCNTADEELKKHYMYFITEISPKLAEVDNLLHKKLVNAADIATIEESDKAFFILLRGIRKALEMFREENIPLNTKIAERTKEFGETAGAMTVEKDGEIRTLQQASKLLGSPKSELRKSMYEKVWTRRIQDADTLDALLTDLISLRNQVAQNAGYESYVEYRWDDLKRFDYTQEDVFNFHQGVKEHIVPLLQARYEEKAKKLGVSTIKPYDLIVEESLLEPLKPFEDDKELIKKGIFCLNDIDPLFAQVLDKMNSLKHLDLGSRPNKRPGGYMSPLPVSKYPFIFMNAAKTQTDVKTLLHESGHAVHDILSSNLEYDFFRDTPMEIAEVASMSMELISMEHRGRFYKDESELKRAKREQIEDIIDILPWISIIDSFQYWIYKNPTHTIDERDSKMVELLETYQPWVDRTDYKSFQKKRRQSQLHIFEVPFYYIEYGIAQLASIGVWKNYLTDPKKALEQYKAALSLGYTRPLPELYATAGISFDFSPARIKELAEFVQGERAKLTD